MKSALLFVLSVLSVVRSTDIAGLLYIHHDDMDYIACDVTAEPQSALIFEASSLPATMATATTKWYLSTVLRSTPTGNSIVITTTPEQELSDHEGYLTAIKLVNDARGWNSRGLKLGEPDRGGVHVLMHGDHVFQGGLVPHIRAIDYKFTYEPGRARGGAMLCFHPFTEGPPLEVSQPPSRNSAGSSGQRGVGQASRRG